MIRELFSPHLDREQPALEGRRRARHVQVLSYKFIDVLDVSLLIIHIYPSNSQWELWIESIHLHKIINRT